VLGVQGSTSRSLLFNIFLFVLEDSTYHSLLPKSGNRSRYPGVYYPPQLDAHVPAVEGAVARVVPNPYVGARKGRETQGVES
jgi:hypothetical protein